MLKIFRGLKRILFLLGLAVIHCSRSSSGSVLRKPSIQRLEDMAIVYRRGIMHLKVR